MTKQLADIPSPCIGVCQLGADNMCLGCLRTPEEIRLWKAGSVNDKLAILKLLRHRRRERGMVGRGERRHRGRRGEGRGRS